ncbi:MAG: hypothetical protein WCR67_03955 [Bacilli bacterium]
MEYIKKVGVSGFIYLGTLILAIVGFAIYMATTGTPYFVSYGVDPLVVTMAILTIIVCLAEIALPVFLPKLDYVALVLKVAICVFLMIGLCEVLLVRLYNIPTLLTFENNPANNALAIQCIVGIVFYLLAIVAAVAGAFFKTTAEEPVAAK